MAKNKTKDTSLLLTTDIKALIANNIDNAELKGRIEEYIQAKKLVEKLAKEIMKALQTQSKTQDYLSDLEADLKALEDETKDAKILSELPEDAE